MKHKLIGQYIVGEASKM